MKKVLLVLLMLNSLLVVNVYAQVDAAVEAEQLIEQKKQTGLQKALSNQSIEQFLTTVEDLYAMYDMIDNSINVIENQVKQYQQMINTAKSIPLSAEKLAGNWTSEWENIDWSNMDYEDWKDLWSAADIRDELADSGKWVDQSLLQVQNIRNLMESPCICVGDSYYSVKDICGFGADGKNIKTAFEEMGKFCSEQMGDIAEAWEEGLDASEQSAILRKYHLTGKQYYVIQQQKNLVNAKVADAINKASDEAYKLKKTADIESKNKWLSELYATANPDGTIPQAALLQTIMHLLAEMGYQFTDLVQAVDNSTGFLATQELAKQGKENVEKEKEIKTKEKNDNMHRTMNAFIVE